jgi:hypothetical protein
MQGLVLLCGYLGLAAAQLVDISVVDAVPPVFITPAVAVQSQQATYSAPVSLPTDAASEDSPDAKSAKRWISIRDGTCAPQPAGSGPVSDPDTPDAFLANQYLQVIQSRDLWSTILRITKGLAEGAPTPAGYNSVFTNLQASLTASMYMGLWTLQSFDTTRCASLCDQNDGCVAFNVYIERDPSLDANATNCPNPPSTTNFKCTLWGAPISSQEATNNGQWRDSFHVVITGSNGKLL